jgi:hypothetical protein
MATRCWRSTPRRHRQQIGVAGDNGQCADLRGQVEDQIDLVIGEIVNCRGHVSHETSATMLYRIRRTFSLGKRPGKPAYAWRPSGKRLGCVTMAEIVLRVRLVGGDHVDVTYGEQGATADEVAEHVISTLVEDGGTLRCHHGDRLIVLYGRGVATVEIAPRGAVL